MIMIEQIILPKHTKTITLNLAIDKLKKKSMEEQLTTMIMRVTRIVIMTMSSLAVYIPKYYPTLLKKRGSGNVVISLGSDVFGKT